MSIYSTEYRLDRLEDRMGQVEDLTAAVQQVAADAKGVAERANMLGAQNAETLKTLEDKLAAITTLDDAEKATIQADLDSLKATSAELQDIDVPAPLAIPEPPAAPTP